MYHEAAPHTMLHSLQWLMVLLKDTTCCDLEAIVTEYFPTSNLSDGI